MRGHALFYAALLVGFSLGNVLCMSAEDSLSLEEATKALYRIFSFDPPSVIEGCPCCIEKKGVDVLLTTSLHALEGKDLWSYVSSLFYTVGNETDFRYLLPRIFELAAIYPAESNYPEVVLRKLGLAGWSDWTAKEQGAVEGFVAAWFEHTLKRDLTLTNQGIETAEAEAIICGGALAGMQLRPFVNRLRQFDVSQIKDLIENRLAVGEESAFWADCPDALREFRTLLGH